MFRLLSSELVSNSLKEPRFLSWQASQILIKTVHSGNSYFVDGAISQMAIFPVVLGD